MSTCGAAGKLQDSESAPLTHSRRADEKPKWLCCPYIPWVSIVATTFMLTGLGVWVVFASQARSTTRQAFATLGLRSSGFAFIDTAILTSAIGCVGVAVSLLTVAIYRNLMLLQRDSLGDLRRTSLRMYMFLNAVFSTLAWMLMLWMAFLLLACGIWVAVMTVIEQRALSVSKQTAGNMASLQAAQADSEILSTLYLQARDSLPAGQRNEVVKVLSSLTAHLNRSLPGNSTSSTCPLYCWDVAQYRSLVQGPSCICDSSRLLIAHKLAQSTRPQLRTAIIGLALAFIGLTWIIMHFTSQLTVSRLLQQLQSPGSHLYRGDALLAHLVQMPIKGFSKGSTPGAVSNKLKCLIPPQRPSRSNQLFKAPSSPGTANSLIQHPTPTSLFDCEDPPLLQRPPLAAHTSSGALHRFWSCMSDSFTHFSSARSSLLDSAEPSPSPSYARPSTRGQGGGRRGMRRGPVDLPRGMDDGGGGTFASSLGLKGGYIRQLDEVPSAAQAAPEAVHNRRRYSVPQLGAEGGEEEAAQLTAVLLRQHSEQGGCTNSSTGGEEAPVHAVPLMPQYWDHGSEAQAGLTQPEPCSRQNLLSFLQLQQQQQQQQERAVDRDREGLYFRDGNPDREGGGTGNMDSMLISSSEFRGPQLPVRSDNSGSLMSTRSSGGKGVYGVGARRAMELPRAKVVPGGGGDPDGYGGQNAMGHLGLNEGPRARFYQERVQEQQTKGPGFYGGVRTGVDSREDVTPLRDQAHDGLAQGTPTGSRRVGTGSETSSGIGRWSASQLPPSTLGSHSYHSAEGSARTPSQGGDTPTPQKSEGSTTLTEVTKDMVEMPPNWRPPPPLKIPKRPMSDSHGTIALTPSAVPAPSQTATPPEILNSFDADALNPLLHQHQIVHHNPTFLPDPSTFPLFSPTQTAAAPPSQKQAADPRPAASGQPRTISPNPNHFPNHSPRSSPSTRPNLIPATSYLPPTAHLPPSSKCHQPRTSNTPPASSASTPPPKQCIPSDPQADVGSKAGEGPTSASPCPGSGKAPRSRRPSGTGSTKSSQSTSSRGSNNSGHGEGSNWVMVGLSTEELEVLPVALSDSEQGGGEQRSAGSS